MSRPPIIRPSDLSTIAEERSNASTSTTTLSQQRQRSNSRASALSLSEEPSSLISQLTDPTIGYGGPPSSPSTPLDHTLLTHTGALPPLILEERGEEDSYFRSSISPTAGMFQGAGISPVAEDPDGTSAAELNNNRSDGDARKRKHAWIRVGAVLALMFIAGVVAGTVVSSQGGDSSSSSVTSGSDREEPSPTAIAAVPTVAPSTISVTSTPTAVPTIPPTDSHQPSPVMNLPPGLDFPILDDNLVGGGDPAIPTIPEDIFSHLCPEEVTYYATYVAYWGVASSSGLSTTITDYTLSQSQQPSMGAWCTGNGRAFLLGHHPVYDEIQCQGDPQGNRVQCQSRSSFGPNVVRIGCCGSSREDVNLIMGIPNGWHITYSSVSTTAGSLMEQHDGQENLVETASELYTLTTMKCEGSHVVERVGCPPWWSIPYNYAGIPLCGESKEIPTCEESSTTNDGTTNCTEPLGRARARSFYGQGDNCIHQRKPFEN